MKKWCKWMTATSANEVNKNTEKESALSWFKYCFSNEHKRLWKTQLEQRRHKILAIFLTKKVCENTQTLNFLPFPANYKLHLWKSRVLFNGKNKSKQKSCSVEILYKSYLFELIVNKTHQLFKSYTPSNKIEPIFHFMCFTILCQLF